MKKKSIISIGIIAAIAILFAYYIYKNIDTFSSLSLVNPIYILLLVLIFTITLTLNGILLDVLMRPFGVKLKLKESFGLASITNFYNLITPFRGGMAARAIYLKKKHNFPYINFLSTLAGIYVLVFLVASLAGLLSMIFIYLYYSIFNLLIFLLFLGVLLFMLGIIILSPKLPACKNKWLNRICKVINGWNLIKNNKRIVIATLTIALVQLVLGSIGTLITYNIFGISIGFFQSLFIASIGSLSILAAITPGNLGIGDAINVFSASIMGINLHEAVAAVLLGRAVNLTIIFILGPIFSYLLLNTKNKK